HVRVRGVELADVARVFVVVDDLFTVCHAANPLSSGAALQATRKSVCLPFDLGQVDTLFEHVPQRRQLTQLVHRLGHLAGGVVDLFLGGEAAEGEADRAVRQLVVAAQGAQHVGRLQRGGGTGGTGGNRQVLERHDQRLAFHVVEAQVEVVRYALGHAAVDVQFLDALDLAVEAVAEGQDALVLLHHLFPGDAKGLAHADDLVSGQGAGTHAPLVAATVDQRLQTHARLAAYVQGADALRTVGLVGGEGHQVDLHGLQVDGHLAGRLGGVDVEQHPAGTGQLTDGGDVVDGADLVVDVHDRHQDGVLAQRRLDHGRSHQAVFARLEIGHLEAFALQLAGGIQHRLVLDLRGDDVLALGAVEVRHALDGEVVGLGGTAGPDDLAGIGVDQFGDLATGVFHRLLGLPAEDVG